MALTVFIAAALAATAASAEPVDVSRRLAEVRAFSINTADEVWPGFGSAPFGLLLIDGDRESLLCHVTLPQGFQAAGRDAKTGCTLSSRPRSGFPDTLLSAMPLFGPPSVIVMGTPVATGR